MKHWVKPAFVSMCLAIFWATCLLITACAPDKDTREFLPGVQGEFQKVAVGSWQSKCTAFSENEASRSEILKLDFATDLAKSERFVYGGTKCAGQPLSHENMAMDIEIKDVAERNPGAAVLELTNRLPQDFAVYRTVIRAAVDKRTLTTSVLKMSYWERGSEHWVPEFDIDSLTVTTYDRQ